ncbi:MAG: COX15/CtaA family protein [Rhodospirillales bacterium]|nr:COX15/CtaA family protein [Rhodospirillales bacterium]
MPFDDKGFAPDAAPADLVRARRRMAVWLFIIAAMILVMVVLGGATRLTGSGLSIMEWAPLSGALPPLSEADWQKLYHLYQQIPQYDLVNKGFGLAGFKHIFWLEWVHRLWGRLIGVVFFVPLVVFWRRGAVDRRLLARLVLFFVLGGLQGAVGWFMVASGFFADSTAVEPTRLVAHLGLALALYGAILWTGLSLWRPDGVADGPPMIRRLAAATLVLVSLTILAGGFVAGLHAGLDYNTFPLMAGHLIPPGYASLHPFARNLIANIAAVQFDHRLLATLTALTALTTAAFGLARSGPGPARAALAALGVAVLAQYGLGVATLLAMVPVDLAVTHQAVAVLLLTAAITAVHALRAAPRKDAP